MHISGYSWDRLQHIAANVQAQLDEATYPTTWAEGRAMTAEQAIAYALEPTA